MRKSGEVPILKGIFSRWRPHRRASIPTGLLKSITRSSSISITRPTSFSTRTMPHSTRLGGCEVWPPIFSPAVYSAYGLMSFPMPLSQIGLGMSLVKRGLRRSRSIIRFRTKNSRRPSILRGHDPLQTRAEGNGIAASATVPARHGCMLFFPSPARMPPCALAR